MSDQSTAYCMHCGTTNVVTPDTTAYVVFGTWYVKCQCGMLLPL